MAQWNEPGRAVHQIVGIFKRAFHVWRPPSLKCCQLWSQEWAVAHGMPIAMKDSCANTASTYKLQEDSVPTNILQGHDEIVWAVVVSGDRLFSASADKTIRVWDVATRRCEQVRRIGFYAGWNKVRM